ncbi:MAG: RDD family protein [Acidimicrobiia bacterium]
MSYEDRISIATPEGVDLQLTLAGLGSRAVARIVDQAIQTGVIVALGLLAAVAAGGPGGGADVAGAAFLLLVFVVQFGYDVLFETLASGRTPGKRWSGLRVVRADGGPVAFVPSAVRNLLRLVDFLPGVYAVGMVAVLASGRNQRLGDMAAGTLVVRERGGRRPVDRAAAPAAAGGGDAGSGTAAWDVSAVTAEEVATVRRFLERRAGLTGEARARLAAELAQRLRPKVVGPPPRQAPEDFLEALAATKAARS